MPGETENTVSVDAFFLIIHVEHLVVAQELPASIASLHLHSRPALLGQHTIAMLGKSSIIRKALLN